MNTYPSEIISVGVTEIPGPYLSAHVPPIERCSREFQPSAVEHHHSHRRQGVPLKIQLGKPWVTKVKSTPNVR